LVFDKSKQIFVKGGEIMKQHLDVSMTWRILIIFFVVVLACAFATRLPAQSIRDFKDVAGKWEGKLSSTDGWDSPIAIIINEDGTGDTFVPQNGLIVGISDNGRFPNEWKVVDGKLSSRNKISGDTGFITLFEGGGKRVLEYISKNGALRGSYEPAPK
jgi:hypothetical protein